MKTCRLRRQYFARRGLWCGRRWAEGAWIEPAGGFAIVEYEAFTISLGHSGSLAAAIEELLKYDWLPVDGRDFRIQFDRASANGVSIESQVYYVL